MNIAELRNITKTFNNKQVINNLNLTIHRGERLVILGPSGCGKTTILRLLAGFIAPEEGKILINSKIASADGKIIIPPDKRNIGMVFQDLALWPHLTVKGNLEFGLKAKKIPKKIREDKIHNMLKLISMEEYANVKPAELSGGQQQRVALARALIQQPQLLLMDEPLSSLDFELNMKLRKEIIILQEKIGFTLLYVTHNHQEAFDIGTRIIVMDKGKIILEGEATKIEKYFQELYEKVKKEL